MLRHGIACAFGSTALVSAALAPVVLAAEENNNKSTRVMRPSQFPIYEEPKEIQLVYVPEKPSSLTQNVSVVRKHVWKWMETYEEYNGKVKVVYKDAKAYAEDTLTYLRADAGIVPRAVLIVVAGLGGSVAGYKGGVMRKALFASAGMGTAAAICYPNQAIDITKTGWEKSTAQIKDMWHDARHTKNRDDKKPKELNQSACKEDDSKDKTVDAVNISTPVDKSKLDFGQSKEEDKDMYTTRGS